MLDGLWCHCIMKVKLWLVSTIAGYPICLSPPLFVVPIAPFMRQSQSSARAACPAWREFLHSRPGGLSFGNWNLVWSALLNCLLQGCELSSEEYPSINAKKWNTESQPLEYAALLGAHPLTISLNLDFSSVYHFWKYQTTCTSVWHLGLEMTTPWRKRRSHCWSKPGVGHLATLSN